MAWDCVEEIKMGRPTGRHHLRKGQMVVKSYSVAPTCENVASRLNERQGIDLSFSSWGYYYILFIAFVSMTVMYFFWSDFKPYYIMGVVLLFVIGGSFLLYGVVKSRNQ